jgi:hypothetical protein
VLAARKAAKQQLVAAGEAFVTDTPNLVVASAHYDSEAGKWLLTLEVLERDSDIAGIRVREVWPTRKLIDETYSTPPALRKAYRYQSEGIWYNWFVIEVTPRTATANRMDGKAWEEWSTTDDVIVARAQQPSLFVASPESAGLALISVIDEAGRESNAVPISCWLSDGQDDHDRSDKGSGVEKTGADKGSGFD